jgi:hypothetical protein
MKLTAERHIQAANLTGVLESAPGACVLIPHWEALISALLRVGSGVRCSSSARDSVRSCTGSRLVLGEQSGRRSVEASARAVITRGTGGESRRSRFSPHGVACQRFTHRKPQRSGGDGPIAFFARTPPPRRRRRWGESRHLLSVLARLRRRRRGGGAGWGPCKAGAAPVDERQRGSISAEA